MKAPVNRIIDTSFVDGPGNRTAIFLQSCNFTCLYCHNPETIHMCHNCGLCVETCPAHALSMTDEGVVYDFSKCVQCDTCIKTCPHMASPKVQWLTPKDIEDRVAGNMPFIRGITTSGGECSNWKEFLTELYERVHFLGLTCLMDSNGSVLNFSKEEALMKYCDGVMLDIKATDPQLHKQLTGQSNEMVLKNAVWLASQDKLTEVRTVCTSTLLNNEQTITDTAELLKDYLQTSHIRYRLIRWRPFGVREPYRCMGCPDDTEMERLKNLALSIGFSDVIIT